MSRQLTTPGTASRIPQQQQRLSLLVDNHPSSSPISRSTPPTASSSSPPPMSPNNNNNNLPFFSSFNNTPNPSLSLSTQLFPNSASRLSSLAPRFRSQSEPPPPTTSQDVNMEDDTQQRLPRYRARSEFSSRSPHEDPEYDTQDKLAVLLEEDLGYLECPPVPVDISSAGSPTTTNPNPLVRTHSSASTEIVDPDSQDIMAGLATKGVQVRDFAFPQPHHQPSSSSYVPPPPRVTEIFDQYRALTEIDYRWSQHKRTYPVQGRTMRRLLDMGWLTPEELRSRGAQVDWDELERYDADVEEEGGQYPWRPFRWTKIPNATERMDMLAARRMLWWHVDRLRSQQDNTDAWETEMRRQVALHMARVEERDRLMNLNMNGSSSSSSKRRLDDDDDDDGQGGGASDGDSLKNDNQVDENGVKRRRLTPERSTFPMQQQQQQSQPQPSRGARQHVPYPAYNMQYPALIPPAKQYPAPLHTYNPELYPDAATVIESAAQSSSQPRPVIPPPRADTPPLSEEEQGGVGGGAGAGGAGGNPDVSPGRRLVHPRTLRMKGGLSRTQTFTELRV